jgi:hypothetical protein
MTFGQKQGISDEKEGETRAFGETTKWQLGQERNIHTFRKAARSRYAGPDQENRRHHTLRYEHAPKPQEITDLPTAYYFGTIAWYGSALLLSSMTLYSLFLGFMPYWLRYWAESSGPGVRYYSIVYLLLAVGALALATMTIANTFLLIAPQSAKTLYSRLLYTVMAAP